MRMLSTVAGLHPKSCAIENFDRPTELMRMMVALRKTVLSVVPKRILSKASHCSSVNVHAAMTTSVQLVERNQLHRVLLTIDPQLKSFCGFT